MSDDIQTPQPEETGLIAYMFTNHAEQAPALQQLLDLFYRGAYTNTIGLMQAKNKETGQEELLLVGIQHSAENTYPDTIPLARILTPEQANNYVGPDGRGGWFEDEDAPVQLELELN